MKETTLITFRSFARTGLAVTIGATLLASCGARETGGGDEEKKNKDGAASVYREGFVNVPEDEGEPIEGGTMTFAGYLEPRSYDPAVTMVSGASGGIELANVYDTLMRYDVENHTLEPRMAEKLDVNDDNTVFTLTLREGIKFSDGTPLDAEAVKYSMDRYAQTPTAPEVSLWNENVEAVTVKDPKTVEIILKGPFPTFGQMLSTGPGMIVAKSAGAGESFKPVGAGPFTVESIKPNEETVLAGNPEYWGGKPPLEKIRMVYYNDEDLALDALNSKDIDATYFRVPDKTEAAVDPGRSAYVNMVGAAGSIILNAAEGHPTADPRVRKAMLLGLDPQLGRDRAYDGKGISSKVLFPEYSRWYSEEAAIPVDLEEAKKLVEEAKADGFDGKVGYITTSAPQPREMSLAVKANLDAIGFEVTPEYVRSIADLLPRAASGDYDMLIWGINLREGDPYAKMVAAMRTDGNQRFGMAASPEMDKLIDEFKVAASDEDKKAVMDKIQLQYAEDIPFLSFAPYPESFVWNEAIHGVTGTGNSMVFFDKTWKD